MCFEDAAGQYERRYKSQEGNKQHCPSIIPNHFEIFRAEGEERLIRKLKEEGWTDDDIRWNLEDEEIRARLEGRPSPKLIAEIKFVVAAAVLPFPFVLPFMIGIWTAGGFEKLSAPLGAILMFLGILLGICWIFVGLNPN